MQTRVSPPFFSRSAPVVPLAQLKVSLVDRFTLMLHRALASPTMRRHSIGDVYRSMTYGQLHSHAVLAAPPPGAAGVTEATKLASFFDGAAPSSAGVGLPGWDAIDAAAVDVDAAVAAADAAAAATAALAAADDVSGPVGGGDGSGIQSEWSLLTSATPRRPGTAAPSLAQSALLAAARAAVDAAAGAAEECAEAAALWRAAVVLVSLVAAAAVAECAGGADALLHRCVWPTPAEAGPGTGSEEQWRGESQCCGVRAASARSAAVATAGRALGASTAQQAAWARQGSISVRVRATPIPPQPAPAAPSGFASVLSRLRRVLGGKDAAAERIEGDLITFGPRGGDDAERTTVALFSPASAAGIRVSLREQAAAAAAAAAKQWAGDGAVAGYAVVVRSVACTMVPHSDRAITVSEVGLASLETAGAVWTWPYDGDHTLGPVGIAVAAVAVWRRRQRQQMQQQQAKRGVLARLLGGRRAPVAEGSDSDHVWVRAATGDLPTAVRVRQGGGEGRLGGAGGSLGEGGSEGCIAEAIDLELEVSLEEASVQPADIVVGGN